VQQCVTETRYNSQLHLRRSAVRLLRFPHASGDWFAALFQNLPDRRVHDAPAIVDVHPCNVLVDVVLYTLTMLLFTVAAFVIIAALSSAA